MKFNTRENFMNILVDCRGYSEQEAEETANEYRNNIESWISDCGGDEIAVSEAKEFCGIN